MKGQNAQTRAFRLDGITNHCNFDAPYYYYQRGRFLRRAFFDRCLPLGIVVENIIPIFISKLYKTESTPFGKREWSAQMALPLIVTSMPPGTTPKWEDFYVEIFLISAFPLE